MKPALLLLFLSLILVLSACSWTTRDGAPGSHPDIDAIADATPRREPISKSGNPETYVVNGVRYYTLKERDGFSQAGIASWYGTKFHGRPTASGEPYDMYKMTAAHKTLPIPSYVKVTNLENGKSVMVRVNDRGPFVADRIIDLSYVAAIKLDMTRTGTARVRIDAWSPERESPDLPPVSSVAPTGAASTGVVSTGVVSTDSAPMPAQTQTQTQTPAAVGVNIPAKGADTLYYLQLGSFANRHNAQRLVSKLASLVNDQVKMLPVETALGMMFRVQLGPYDRREKITTLEKRFKQLGLGQSMLVIDKKCC